MVGRFETFTFAIAEISQYWNKIATEEMKKYGLKSAYAVYLVTLYRNCEGITASNLCEIANKDKADISRAVSVMEEQGLVYREMVNNNGYRALIKLTEKGRIAAEQVRERANLAVEVGGEGITDRDREIFYDALGKILENLRRISKEGLPQ